MEPASIVTIVVTTLSVVIKTSKTLKDLVERYRHVDTEITLIIVKLNTMEATMSQLASWLQTEHSVQKEVLVDLKTAIGACEFVVGEIYNHVKRVKSGWLGGKIRHMWSEGQLWQYQRSLDSQTAALGVMLSVAVLRSHTQQRSLLDNPNNRLILEVAQDQVASPNGSDATLPSASSFDFDHELFDSKIYMDKFPKRARQPSPPSALDEYLAAKEGASTERHVQESPTSSDARTVHTTSSSSSGSSAISPGNETFSIRQKRWHRTEERSKLSEELCHAVSQGMSALTANLCDGGADVNCRIQKYKGMPFSEKGPVREVRSLFGKLLHDPYGYGEPTILHHAADNGYLDIMKTLIAHGANPNPAAKGGRTPLHIANDDAVELLLSLGADPSIKDDTGAVPLHYMAASGHLKAIRALTKCGGTLNSINKLQQTPIHLACAQGHYKAVLRLIDAGAFADAGDADGLRPLHYAARHGHDRIVRMLIKAGVDPEASSKRSWRPLHYAASEGCVKVVRTLISTRVNVDLLAEGQTPLHLAIAHGHKEIIEMLLSASANVEAENERGEKPIHLAAAARLADISSLLLRYKADPNAKTRNGNTALLEVCLSQSSAQDTLFLVELLLENGARINTKNRTGQTALSSACSRSQSALVVVQTLLRYHARVSHADYVSLWRNRSLPSWEKKAIKAALDEVSNDLLKKDEVEWLMLSL